MATSAIGEGKRKRIWIEGEEEAEHIRHDGQGKGSRQRLGEGGERGTDSTEGGGDREDDGNEMGRWQPRGGD
ncbi:UNVERIFIED_CONTAM: hypothetical protein Sindi_2148800 [Sesamum indicum]